MQRRRGRLLRGRLRSARRRHLGRRRHRCRRRRRQGRWGGNRSGLSLCLCLRRQGVVGRRRRRGRGRCLGLGRDHDRRRRRRLLEDRGDHGSGGKSCWLRLGRGLAGPCHHRGFGRVGERRGGRGLRCLGSGFGRRVGRWRCRLGRRRCGLRRGDRRRRRDAAHVSRRRSTTASMSWAASEVGNMVSSGDCLRMLSATFLSRLTTPASGGEILRKPWQALSRVW